ncbi:MAG: hypothetical protein M1837_001357 [Sclerophora amabilis]|nr:MAG: hypothetical protein M1837_001357 [Sclerophora amabilis]
MAVEVTLNTPLADALSSVIQPKLVEVGWSTGGQDDETALAEYIILMLVNGKTQDQIAAELSGDLLNLGPDDPGAVDFSRWLFEQVEILDSQLNGTQSIQAAPSSEAGSGHDEGAMQAALGGSKGNSRDGDSITQDTEMGDNAEGLGEKTVPTGPRSMRKGGNPNVPKRLFNQLSKAMDRTQDGVLHRVRPQQGTERINTHSREMPRGPRNNPMRPQRPPVGRGMGPMQTGMMPNTGPAGPMSNMTPQQHMQLLAMYEEQAKMMAQILSPQQQQSMFPGPPMGGQMMNGGFSNPGFPPQHHQQPGRSLFDRIEEKPRRQNGPLNKRQHQNVGNFHNQQNTQDQNMDTDANQVTNSFPDPSSSMEVESSQQPNEGAPPADTICKFNLACSKQDCPYAHQSPAAPPGTTIDVQDNCPFGAACKSKKCVARHPSPAVKMTHQAEQECKFFPSCTNPACPFKHPTMPLCRNGADCTRPGCKFTHVKTVCKYNPCLNPICPFKHADGQKRGAFDDKVWVADQAKGEGEQEQGRKHVSERKFVDEADGEEELIIPTGSSAGESSVFAEVAGAVT